MVLWQRQPSVILKLNTQRDQNACDGWLDSRKYLADREILRQTVNEVIRDFIDHERQHMAMEERIFFPVAVEVLRPQEWAEIYAKSTARTDPLGAALEDKYRLLRHLILQWEQEAESERLQRARGPSS